MTKTSKYTYPWRTLVFTHLGTSFPPFYLILQYLLLSLEHAALLT